MYLGYANVSGCGFDSLYRGDTLQTRTVFPVAKSQADAARRDEFRHHNYATYSQCIVSQLVLSLMASGDDSGAIPYGYVFQIWQSNHFHGLLRFY